MPARKRTRSPGSGDDAGPGVFSGLVVYLSPQFSEDWTMKRRALMSKQIAVHGGRVAESLCPDVTHVIMSSRARVTDFAPPPKDAVIVTPDWVSDALRHKRAAPEPTSSSRNHHALLSPTSASSSAQSPDHEYGLDESEDTLEEAGQNAKIVEVLGSLAASTAAIGEVYRSRAYERAQKVVAKLQVPLVTVEDVDAHVKNVGDSIMTKIKEIIATGTCAKQRWLESDERVQAMKELTSIWGVGLKTAKELYDRGCRTIDDVRQEDDVPGAVRKSLQWHDELQVRIPRSEVGQISEIVRRALQTRQPRLQVITCGSYRHGNETCGDIDMIITPMEEEDKMDNPAEILSTLVDDLSEQGLLTDHLALPSLSSTHERSTYMGIAQLNPDAPHRRIDIKIYTKADEPFALLYFSGTGAFVRSMRLYAKRHGYSLSDHGIRPASYGETGREILGPSIPCKTEKDIFDVLGLVYLEPNKREYGALAPKNAQ
ncbi:unnamed protein product (mitochondrion) [Plasmodiophora brassicae]|uniref:DNA polymerase n=1 Tax=Plasmodiophora brassicae TaxID=37360 RepID=A0A3P3YEX5_PLABS|nr:unnamed protein product [Plasmodiophora brassicae]